MDDLLLKILDQISKANGGDEENECIFEPTPEFLNGDYLA